jgi:hypothetical protein
MVRILSLFALVATLSTANAITYGGNPVFKTGVIDPSITSGTVVLDSVTLTDCDGSDWTLQVDETIDPVLGWEHSMPAGDFCSVTLHWGSDMELEGTNSQGTLSLEYTETSTTVPFDQYDPSPVDLTPITEVTGKMLTTPQLDVDIL